MNSPVAPFSRSAASYFRRISISVDWFVGRVLPQFAPEDEAAGPIAAVRGRVQRAARGPPEDGGNAAAGPRSDAAAAPVSALNHE